jgi:hypothetical protein
MKIALCAAFILVFTVSYSLEPADSSKTKLKATAVVSLNSNGIAAVPAFSLDDPAIIAAITLSKNRFSYEPTLAYGFNLGPWVIDNWLRYKIIARPTFEFRAGMDVSSFFSDYKLPDETIRQSQRYFTFEIAGVYKITPEGSLSLMYWSDNGRDKGSIKGHFIDLIGERSAINITQHVLLAVNIQLFYINYTGQNDGLFISPKISTSVKNIPFSVFLQITQPFFSNISPSPGFKWNLGLSYTL